MSTVRSTAAYIISDGSESNSRGDATGIPESDLIQYWKAVSSRIPAGYALGVAARESGKSGDLYVTNEHDTDTQDDGSEYDSYGIFQMGKTEAAKALIPPLASFLIDPQNNCLCAAVNFESNLDRILAAAGLDTPNDDVWCYLAWAHNAGVGQPVKSIQTYGLDWAALKARPQNDYMTNKMIPYAEYVLSETRRVPDIGNGEDNHHALSVGSLLVFVGLGALLVFERLA
jgi:hypothetical protein